MTKIFMYIFRCLDNNRTLSRSSRAALPASTMRSDAIFSFELLVPEASLLCALQNCLVIIGCNAVQLPRGNETRQIT